MSHKPSTNWNENITLCKFEHRAEGRAQAIWVNAFDVNRGQRVWRKAFKDHERDMRCIDASLMMHLVNDLYPVLRRMVDNRSIESNQAQESLQLLYMCGLALSPTGHSNPQFGGKERYSAGLIALAASYIRMALKTLDVTRKEVAVLTPRPVKLMYQLLAGLATEAEERYTVEVYENALP